MSCQPIAIDLPEIDVGWARRIRLDDGQRLLRNCESRAENVADMAVLYGGAYHRPAK